MTKPEVPLDVTTTPTPKRRNRAQLSPKAQEASRQNGSLGGRKPAFADACDQQFNFKVRGHVREWYDKLPIGERKAILAQLRTLLEKMEFDSRCF